MSNIYTSQKKGINMKGISPLIASVLLLAIAFTIGTIIAPWAFGLVRADTAAIGNQSNSITDCSAITIENVYLDFDDDKGRVYVLAKGDEQVISANMFTTKGLDMDMEDPSVLPISLSAGNRQLITFNLSVNLTACSNFSKVVIASSCLSDEKTKVDGC